MATHIQYRAIAGVRTRVDIPVKVKIIGCAMLATILVAKVWVRMQITSEGYRLADAQSKTVDLDMQKRELELKLSIMKRRDYLLSEAQTRLGLREPKRSEVWKIE